MKLQRIFLFLFLPVACLVSAQAADEGLILILGAVPQEVPYLVERLDDASEGELHGFPYWRGYLGENEVVVSLTSVGKTHTGMCTALFIEHFKPRFAFMTGTAARINPEKRTGDVVIPKTVFFHDFGSQTETDIVWRQMYQPGTRNQLPLKMEVDAGMRATAAGLIEDYDPHEVTVDEKTYAVTVDMDSVVASSDCFGVRQARIDLLKTESVDLMEMESAPFALVCLQMETPFLIVRAGSNRAQVVPNNDYLIYGPIAAVSAAQMTHYLVSHWSSE